MRRQSWLLMVIGVICTAFVVSPIYNAFGLEITGSVAQKYLITGMTISTKVKTVLKLSFENRTSGTNLSLCAGDVKDFQAGTCPIQLSSSGGPGFMFLTIFDTSQVSGKQIYVINNGPTSPASFVITIE